MRVLAFYPFAITLSISINVLLCPIKNHPCYTLIIIELYIYFHVVIEDANINKVQSKI
jgi:hypothetical protein